MTDKCPESSGVYVLVMNFHAGQMCGVVRSSPVLSGAVRRTTNLDLQSCKNKYRFTLDNAVHCPTSIYVELKTEKRMTVL